MKHPKIKFEEIEVIFSKAEIKDGKSCEKALKGMIERSLSDYYAVDFTRELLWTYDPIAAWQIANYRYRYIKAEVDKNTSIWLRRISFNDEEAITCYGMLRRLYLRLADYRRQLAETGWYEWRLRSVLKKAIEAIETSTVDLLEFLNMVAYLSRRKMWGGQALIAKMTA